MHAKPTANTLPTPCGPEYDGVVGNHSIEPGTFDSWVSKYYTPPLPLPPHKRLTEEILAVINSADIDCGDFLHFSADPFLKTNEDITLGALGTVGKGYCINYSVALFRGLQAQFENCEFEFTKANAGMSEAGRVTLFKLIFSVLQDDVRVYCGDMSSGIPY